MTAICCFNSETGEVQKLARRPRQFAECRSDARMLVQDLWELMPRGDGENKNAEHLAEVRKCLRAEDLAGARAAINLCVGEDAETVNLRGLISELEGDFRSAQRFYQNALQRNRRWVAAESNLRRYYELWTFGRSDVPYYL